MSNQVKEIATSQILPAWTMLRPVRETSVEFLELCDSIKDHGLLKSILVRPHPTRGGYFEVIDGMWRFLAIKSLDLPEIPCIIKLDVVSDEEYMALQIQANAVSYETRPIEFAEQMQRMLQLREFVGAPMKLVELARTVGKSSSWVSSRLKLLSLCDEAKEALRDGTLPLGKAVALARINSPYYQKEFLAKAPEIKTRDFELLVGRFIAEKRNDKMAYRRGLRNEVTLKAKLQSMDSMLMELDRLDNISQIIVQKGLTTALDGARIALEWVLNLHDQGRTAQVKEVRHKLSDQDRREIIGRRRYEELEQLRQMKEKRLQQQRESFTNTSEISE